MNYYEKINLRKDCFIKNYEVINNEIIVYLMDNTHYNIPYSIHNEKSIIYKIKDQASSYTTSINSSYKKYSKYSEIKNINDTFLTLGALTTLCNIGNPNTTLLCLSLLLGSDIYLYIKKNKYHKLINDLNEYKEFLKYYTDYKLEKINEKEKKLTK